MYTMYMQLKKIHTYYLFINDKEGKRNLTKTLQIIGSVCVCVFGR